MSEVSPLRTAGHSDRSHGGRQVSEYFRLERQELSPVKLGGEPSEFMGRAPIDDHLRGAGGGMFTGGLVTNIDSVGGMMCGLAVHPKWIVTTSLAARVVRLDQVGPLRIQGRVIRRGRNSVVGSVEVTDEGADQVAVASAVVTCAILDPGNMELNFERPVMVPMPPLAAASPWPEAFFHIEPGTGLVTRLNLVDYLRNPWGILHGGAVASLADVAATRAVGVTGGRPVASADMALHYLSPVRIGPVEARCRIVGTRHSGTVVRVSIHDLGVDARLAALASVVVREV